MMTRMEAIEVMRSARSPKMVRTDNGYAFIEASQSEVAEAIEVLRSSRWKKHS